ncbi:MAG: hypothetical protein LBV67_04400 [Streptococcaceae bacterium]|jgi:hypothetical protein|nr:hypothetical protein [Streptococcaceae bacterium]
MINKIVNSKRLQILFKNHLYIITGVIVFLNILVFQSWLVRFGNQFTIYNLIASSLRAVLVLFATWTVVIDKKLNFQKLFPYAIFGNVALINFATTGSNVLLVLFLFLFAIRNLEFNKIVSVFFVAQMMAATFIVFFNRIGLLPSVIDNRGAQIRDSFGFSGSNIFSLLVSFIIIEGLYLSSNKKNNLKYIFSLVLSAIVYLITDTRTGFIISLSAIILFFIAEKFSKNIFSFALALGSLSMMLFGLFLPTIYSSNIKLFAALDSVLSGRLSFANQFLNLYETRALGTRIFTVPNDQLTGSTLILDNFYIRNLLDSGWIFILLFFAVTIYAIIFLYKNKFINELIILFLCLLIGNFENTLTSISVCILFVIIYATVDSKKLSEGIK